MKNPSLTSLFSPFIGIVKRYHLTIFIVVLVSGLATAVMLLNNILQQSQDTSSYAASTGSQSFDQATINRLKALHSSNEQVTTFTPGSGRLSPFGE